MAKATSGYIQQLPSGSFRVSVYAGTDPLTGLQTACGRHARPNGPRRSSSASCSSRPQLAASPRRTPPWRLDRYAEVADWDLSTRKANEVYIRRVIKPALGHLQVRKIRGPLLDLLYAELEAVQQSGRTESGSSSTGTCHSSPLTP